MAVRKAEPPPPSFLRAHVWLLASIVAILFITADDRHAGTMGDGRQMIWTAVAIAETGQLGQARARDLTVPREQGDAVSRFGLGMSFAQVPAAFIAPSIERRFGPGSSQPLFLIAPFVFVLTAAVLCGMTVRQLGGGLVAQRAALILATLGSPLASYATTDYSESLQAASLICAYWAAIAATRGAASSGSRLAFVAGAACGVAVLTKSALLVIAPFALLPFAVPLDMRKVVRAAVAFVVVLALWAYLDFARFGHLFGGYAGERFSHPFLDGLWRLTIGPNKGLLFYFPAVIAAAIGLVRLIRTGNRRQTSAASASFCCLGALLLVAAPWWAWHGDDGWGPRLLVAAIPLLVVWAAIEIANWSRWACVAVLSLSVLVNVPPLLQHPTPVFTYRASSGWPAVDESVAAGLPRFARRVEQGKTVVVPDFVLSTVPSASPFVVLPWYFRATSLAHPPWLTARADIAPPRDVESSARTGKRPFVWGRTFSAGGVGLTSHVYDEGLADQVIRAQQLRLLPQALDLVRKLGEIAPSGFADALLLETYRLQKRRADAVTLMGRLPVERRSHPSINVVLALFERDRGEERGAKAFLASVADSFPDSPVTRALAQPLSQWPEDFASMTLDESLQVARRE